MIYRAQAGETPILSGGKPITGWQPDEKGRWKAPAPVENFRQLYVNGVRAIRARGAPPAGIKLVDNVGYTTTAVEMAGWKNPADLEFCYIIVWTHARCKVAGIRREGDHAVVTMLQPYFTHARRKGGNTSKRPTTSKTPWSCWMSRASGIWTDRRRPSTTCPSRARR